MSTSALVRLEATLAMTPVFDQTVGNQVALWVMWPPGFDKKQECADLNRHITGSAASILKGIKRSVAQTDY